MTLQGVIDKVDRIRANFMSRQDKIDYINEIEGKFHQEIVIKHEHTAEQETCPHYDDNTEPSTALLAPAPYDRMYEYYLMAKIDMLNGETEKENNNMARFEKEYGDLSDYWTREHMPITRVPKFII